jgi:hypothetical protein
MIVMPGSPTDRLLRPEAYDQDPLDQFLAARGLSRSSLIPAPDGAGWLAPDGTRLWTDGGTGPRVDEPRTPADKLSREIEYLETYAAKFRAAFDGIKSAALGGAPFRPDPNLKTPFGPLSGDPVEDLQDLKLVIESLAKQADAKRRALALEPETLRAEHAAAAEAAARDEDGRRAAAVAAAVKDIKIETPKETSDGPR